MELKLQKDKYRKSRGGYSRILTVSCAKCENIVALYQKDGPGILKRMYLDRIIRPESLRKIRERAVGKIPALRCSKCQELIGIPSVYKAEKRPCFRIVKGSISKKVTSTKKT